MNDIDKKGPYLQILTSLGIFDLTPVQEVDEIFYKRDDLFCPFGKGSVNGGKLRQGIYLLVTAKQKGYTKAITGSSLISAQAPIVAIVTHFLGMSCLVLYGGTKKETLFEKHHMPRLVKYFGADIEICSSGRTNVLLHKARQLSKEKDFIVEYGINSKNYKYFVPFYETTAYQTQNLPNDLDHLIITCGSGISSTGIIYGLKKYNKNVKNIWLVGVGPNRTKKIKDRLASLFILTGINCINTKCYYMDLFGEGLKYETKEEAYVEKDLQMHPNYEAKAYNWVLKNLNLFVGGKICFWVVGGPIKFLA